MQKAKLFTNGKSQAVRLPKNFRFEGGDVYITRLENIVILIPEKDPWLSLISSLDKFSDDFMSDREQPFPERRSDSL